MALQATELFYLAFPLVGYFTCLPCFSTLTGAEMKPWVVLFSLGISYEVAN